MTIAKFAMMRMVTMHFPSLPYKGRATSEGFLRMGSLKHEPIFRGMRHNYLVSRHAFRIQYRSAVFVLFS